MIVYRLSKKRFKDDLSGKGAELSGGRWNSKGHAMVYTSESRSLCTTEIAVHTPLGNIPIDYYLIIIEISENASILELVPNELPSDWKSLPHPNSTQLIGDTFLKERKYLVLKVPSAVVQGDFNYLINPFHGESSNLKILKTEVFNFDERLFRK